MSPNDLSSKNDTYRSFLTRDEKEAGRNIWWRKRSRAIQNASRQIKCFPTLTSNLRVGRDVLFFSATDLFVAVGRGSRNELEQPISFNVNGWSDLVLRLFLATFGSSIVYHASVFCFSWLFRKINYENGKQIWYRFKYMNWCIEQPWHFAQSSYKQRYISFDYLFTFRTFSFP